MLLIFVVMLCQQLARASAGDNINKIWEVLSAVVWGASDDGTMRVELIGHFKPCVTEIYLPV